MNAIEQFLYDVLAGINSLVGNYGVSIIIFTILTITADYQDFAAIDNNITLAFFTAFIFQHSYFSDQSRIGFDQQINLLLLGMYYIVFFC